MRALLVFVLVCASSGASAQVGLGETWQLRLRYGLAWRAGTQGETTPPDLSYQGLTPNDLQAEGWAWYRYFGGTLSVQREAFSLFDSSSGDKVTGGAMLRGRVGLTARFPIGPLRLEPVLGYSFDQLPSFASALSFSTATRHAGFAAARVLLNVGPVTIEGRFALPLISTTTAPAETIKASSSGFSAGGGVRAQLFHTGQLHWGLMLDAAYVSDFFSATRADGTVVPARQSVVRGGLSIDLQWRQPAPVVAALPIEVVPVEVVPEKTVEVPKVGSVAVTVLEGDTKQPLANVSLEVGATKVQTDASGVATVSGLKPGPVSIVARLEKYQRAEEAASVLAGQTAAITVMLVPEKQRVPASITGLVRSTRGGRPIAAELSLRQTKISTRANDKGAFSFRVEAGTYTVKITAPGFRPQTKELTVTDGDQAILNIDLYPAK